MKEKIYIVGLEVVLILVLATIATQVYRETGPVTTCLFLYYPVKGLIPRWKKTVKALRS